MNTLSKNGNETFRHLRVHSHHKLEKSIGMSLKEYEAYENELILINTHHKPVTTDCHKLKAHIKQFENMQENALDDLHVKHCHETCNHEFAVLTGTGISSFTVSDPVKIPTSGTPRTVGDLFVRNIKTRIPFGLIQKRMQALDIKNSTKEPIIIAVLDTGIDEQYVPKEFLWENPDGSGGHGWNFIAENNLIHDDSLDSHGTLVSQYIIEEFSKTPVNAVKLMILKTHDKNGDGKLSDVFQAIQYAVANGANIINASWGFYVYHDSFNAILKHFISKKIKDKNILFITASGNKIDSLDKEAKKISKITQPEVKITESLLRNLAFNNFYPACLSNNSNNIITVTTTDGKKVSPKQNYSNKYVDLGILGDASDPSLGFIYFKLPFSESSKAFFTSGSSFATAIATGIIGANIKKEMFNGHLNKHKVFRALSEKKHPTLMLYSKNLNEKIKEGKYSVSVE